LVKREIFDDSLRDPARLRAMDKEKTRKAEVSIVVGSTSGR